jgi:hypothetical protein
MSTKTENNATSTNRVEEQRFEFVLYINDHIICQRYFNIRDYNEDVLKSYDIKELMDNIAGMYNGQYGSLGIIPKYLQNKSKEYLWDNYNPYFIQKEETSKNIFDKVDNFQFEIKVDKKTVAKSEFCGNFFPPKVRYAVDVREIIPSIMNEIRHYFSQKNYTMVGA